MWALLSGLFFLAYAGINIYTGAKTFALVRYFFPAFKAFIFWPVYIFLCYSFILLFMLRLGRLGFLREWAMLVFPGLLYFFFTLLIFDGIRLALRLFNHPALQPGMNAVATGIALFIAILLMVYGVYHARNIRTVYYTVSLNKEFNRPLRIALVTDLHLGGTVGKEWAAAVVDAVNRAGPDIICIAGDLFDSGLGAVPDPEGVGEELRLFTAPMGVYACPGNHDVDRPSPGSMTGGSLDRIIVFLTEANIRLLLDEVILADELFYLAGRRDARPIGLDQQRKSAEELSAGLDRTIPFIVMDHQPVDFANAEKAGADLILSGHTHRGQFFPGSVITAMMFKNAGAVHHGYWREKTAQGIVSSGAGVWGPPVRIATNSEVVIIDIIAGSGD